MTPRMAFGIICYRATRSTASGTYPTPTFRLRHGRGSEGRPDGEGEDDFRFYISYEEFINAILDDLALPDMTKASEKHTFSYELRRAGYTPVGAACNLALERTMIQGLSASHRPQDTEAAAYQDA